MASDRETKTTIAGTPLGAPTENTALAPTARDGAASGETPIVLTWSAADHVTLPEPGYQLGELIGRGGMGEVVAAQDQRIGREVAVKRIRSQEPSPDAVLRFLREACIQARLDHPAIVPVYELGTDREGRPYFTMKRLAGRTLAQRLEARGAIQPLLRAFIDVCHAIGLAHARGVVHRDLKPSNIMLGDYGEVYVLDWGVARVLAEQRLPSPVEGHRGNDGATTVGAILGTPGYMAPEQVRGEDVGTAADVYALGSILFEILAGEPLHPRGSEPALASTLTHPQAAPGKRATERQVPPELDEACFASLSEDPESRPSARELAQMVQAYVDGDRDVERRRELAAEQFALAREALAAGGSGARASAMLQAGRALALDPQSQQAAQLVTSLILEPPESLPPDLLASLDAEVISFHRKRSKTGIWAYLGLFVFWPLVPFLNVKSWPAILCFYVLLGVGALASWRATRSKRGRNPLVLTMTLMVAVLFAFSRVASPFILTPIIACAMMMFLSTIGAIQRRPLLALSWIAFAMLLPCVLEWTGVVASTYGMSDGLLVIRSDMFGMRSAIDHIALVAVNMILIVTCGAVALSLSRNARAAQRELHIQAWHLRQLLPADGTASNGA